MNTVETVISISIFVIVAVVSFNALGQMLNGGKGTTLVVSLCVASLSVIGLNKYDKDVLLLPYAALGIGILLVFLLLVVIRCFKSSRRSHNKEISNVEERRLRG